MRGGQNRAGIESQISQRISVAILFAPDMLDGEVGKLARELCGAFVERLQFSALYFVTALDLSDQKFGIAANAQGGNAVADGVIEGGEQRVVFGNIVRLAAQFFGKFEN